MAGFIRVYVALPEVAGLRKTARVDDFMHQDAPQGPAFLRRRWGALAAQ